MKAIFKREFKSYFTSAGGYLFLGIFLLAMGVSFVGNISDSLKYYQYPTTAMNTLFRSMPLLLSVMVPLITMGSFADEKQHKTDQLLLTSPNSVTSIVMGKFFGAFSFVAVCLLTTLLYVAVFCIYGTPNLMLTVLAYIAVILMAALFTSVGIFFSSLTESALVAASIGIVSFAVLYVCGGFASLSVVPAGIRSIIGVLDINRYYNMFYSELLSPQPFVYFISLTVLFIFLTVRVIEARRWK